MADPDAKPDRETQAGGDFGSGSGGKGPVHYGSGPLPLQAAEDVLVDLRRATANATFTVTTRGGGTYSWVVPAGAVDVFKGRGIATIQIGGASGTVQWRKGRPGEYDGMVSASSTVQAIPNDSAGNQQGQSMANGSSAPATGIWHVFAAATATDAVTLSDGTRTQQAFVSGATEQWIELKIPVIQGTTYTLAGTGLTILGNAGVVCPS